MSYPVFVSGDVLNASDMNAVGLWRVTGCTVTSVGGTAATASDGVITIGSGNTSVTVANAFSADYRNYKVLMTYGTSSAGGRMNLQLSGATGTSYYTVATYQALGTATVLGLATSGAGETSFYAADSNTAGYAVSLDLHNPFVSTTKTFIEGQWMSNSLGGRFSGVQNTNVSHTGFTLSLASGSFNSGIEIRVYGYRN
jgi:hypothetical protein